MVLRTRFALFFAPTIVQALLSLITLPLATLILGPPEYGAFAVVGAVTGLGGALATSASGMLIPAHYPRLEAEGRSELIRSLLLNSAVISSVFAVVLIAGWSQLSGQLQGIELVDRRSLAYAVAAMFCSLPWSVAYLIVILDGRAGTYSKVIISSALVSTATLLVCLFWLNLGIDALFVASLASAIVLFSGSAIVLVPYLKIRHGGKQNWARKIMRMTLASGIASSMELLQTTVERFVLARFAGVHGVGIYSHAQLYRNMIFSTIKAASNSIWPRSLDEARETGGSFAATKRVWNSIYVALTVTGVFAAFLGDDVVSLLTHGKFREAGLLIPALVIVLFLQFSGKPQVATLYANDEGEYLGKLMGLCATISILALVLAVPILGVWGVLLSLVVQQIIYRIGVHVRARRHRETPFLDRIVVKGVTTISAALLIEMMAAPGPLVGAGLAAAIATFVLLHDRRASADLVSVISRPRGH